jgi:hypothetical protein
VGAVVVIVLVIFLLSGGLYIIVAKPDVYIPLQNGYTFLVPGDMTSQLVLEGLFSILLLSLGTLGGYIIHRSQRNLRDPRLASMLLIIGIALILIGVLGLTGFMQLKTL